MKKCGSKCEEPVIAEQVPEGFECFGKMRFNGFWGEIERFSDLFGAKLVIAAVDKYQAALFGQTGYQAIDVFFQELGLYDLFIETGSGVIEVGCMVL